MIRNFKLLLLVSISLIIVGCGEYKPRVFPEPPIPDRGDNTEIPKEKKKVWAPVTLRGHYLVQQEGDEYTLRAKEVYSSFVKKLYPSIDLGWRLTEGLLRQAKAVELKAQAYYIDMLQLGGDGFQDFVRVNFSEREALESVKASVLEHSRGGSNLSAYLGQRSYQDVRQLHTLYWGIYPDIEKRLLGAHYYDMDKEARYQGGEIYEIEISRSLLMPDIPTEVDLAEEELLLSKITYGYHFLLLVHQPHSDGFRLELDKYKKDPNASQLHRLLNMVDKIVFMDLLEDHIATGEEAIRAFIAAQSLEASPKPIFYGFNRSKEGFLVDSYVYIKEKI